jgi:RimJ/RimL family protein N-acetyltransferase
MSLSIRPATTADADRIMAIIDAARSIMRSTGNPDQWPEGKPSRDQILADIGCGASYVGEEDGRVVATFAFVKGPDPTYKTIYNGHWTDDEQPYYVIHRVASTPESHGVFRSMMDFCFTQTRNIRIDTHANNRIMQHLITSYGFSYCGIIHLLNGEERLAYQRII